MNPIELFRSFSMRQKVTLAVSVVLTLFLFTLIARQVSEPGLSLLYADLEPSTAGEVISRLDAMGVSYRVDGGAIYADAGRRDSLRLELARDGLPRQDVVGYELFDGMNSFAMSSDMFDTAYWRAKEGELARSILAMPAVKGARVHVGQAMGRGLRATRQPATASVTLSSQPVLDAQQAMAVQYLVALAVPGLKPDDVAIIDTQRGLLAGPGISGDVMSENASEVGRAAAMKADLTSLLEARVGRGNVRVNVSLDVSNEAVSRTEKRFDPNGQVLRSTTITDRADSSNGSTGAVTVASNLPEGAGGAGNSAAELTETSETSTYEITEILTQTNIQPGAIKSMSVAVLLDHQRRVAEDGTVTFEPRSAEELSAIEALTRAAAGLDTERGDVLRVESLAFDRPFEEELITAPGAMSRFMDMHARDLVQLSILCIFAMGLMIFVIRPMIRMRPDAKSDLMGGELAPMSLSGPSADGAQSASRAVAGLPAPDPKAQLEDAVRNHEEDAAALLASWLDLDKPNTASGQKAA